VELSHTFSAVSAVFDEPGLVSAAGLVPVLALAERAGLRRLAGEHLRVGEGLCCVSQMVSAADREGKHWFGRRSARTHQGGRAGRCPAGAPSFRGRRPARVGCWDEPRH
jgi:hypothetical protein